jgi:hypothetical protein
MSNNPSESLEDRLARRRRVRNKRFLDKNSIDESEVKVINHSPATQSLDRKSTKRISLLTSSATSTRSTEQRKSSVTIPKNSELPPIENSYSKQNDPLSNNKTNSTPILPQVTKYQWLESENDKQSSAKSLPTNEQQQKFSNQDDKPVTIKETILPSTTTEKSTPIQQETHKKINTHQDEKPIIIKETVLPPATTEKSTPIQQEIHENSHSNQNENPVSMKETFTPILPSTSTQKSNPTLREIYGNSTPNRINNFSQSSESEYPSSHPESTTYRQQKTFNYPQFNSKPIARTTSEQIVSLTKRKPQSIDPMFAKQNSLVLAYLFNKRMVDAELGRAASLNDEQSHRKTAWD